MSLPANASAPGFPAQADAEAGAWSSPSWPAPATSATALEGGAVAEVPNLDTQVADRRTDLIGSVEGRRRYAEYLARLEMNRFTELPEMAAFVTAELERLAPHLTPESAASWLETLSAAISDRDHALTACWPAEDHNSRVQAACARADTALHHLTGLPPQVATTLEGDPTG